MSFSVYSFLNAVFWFNIGLIPIALIQTHGRIVKRYSPVLLGALTVLADCRCKKESPVPAVVRNNPCENWHAERRRNAGAYKATGVGRSAVNRRP